MISDRVRVELEGIVGAEAVLTDPDVLVAYAGDAGLDRGKPEAVVLVRTAEEVQAVVRCALRHRTPFLPRGSGTSLSGGPVASRGGIILECSRMRNVDLDAEGKTASVEPGVINLDLQKALASRRLFFPPDPASQRASCLGGNVAENSGGPLCFKYGVTGHYVLGLDVVLPNGRFLSTGGLSAEYPEYDFTGVLVGSEGTLGVVTRAHLRLINLPAGAATLVARFDSLETAARAVSVVIARGIVPAALELMDRPIIGIIEDFIHGGLPVDAAAILILEVDGHPDGLASQVEEIRKVLEAEGSREVREARTEAERERIWYARRSVAGAIARLAPYHYTQDGTVPRSRLAEVITAVNAIGRRYGLSMGNLAHAGDGNLHPLILFDPQNEEETRKVLKAGMEMLAQCVRAGGVITGEHGVGLEKREAMSFMYTPAELRVMEDVKRVFDSEGLCNPGKIFPETEPASSRETGSATLSPPSGMSISAGDPRRDPRKDFVDLAGADPLLPSRAEEVAACLLAATQEGVPVSVVGGATKLFLGNEAAEEARRVLSTQALAGIVDYAPDDLVLTVRGGTPLSEVHRFLTDSHLRLPWGHPWPGATVGGVLSCNWNSPARLRSGSLRDQVLGLKVVLPRGEIIRCGGRVVKNVAGYDLTKLFVGSMGTLGVIVEATVKLSPRPRRKVTLVSPSLDLIAAVSAGIALFTDTKINPALLMARSTGEDGVPAGGLQPRGSALIVSLEGGPEEVEADLRQIRSGGLDGKGLGSPRQEEGGAGWEAFVAAAVSRVVSGTGDGLFVKGGIPGRRLVLFLRELRDKIRELRGTLSCSVEIGSGVFYALLELPGAGPELLQSLSRAFSARASELGGYWILAAGPAGVKAGGDVWGEPRPTFPLMEALKRTWDPARILNRGRFAGFL